MKQLPDWSDCKDAVDSGEATALQRFIYENEPAENDDEDEFRNSLLEVINEIERGNSGSN